MSGLATKKARLPNCVLLRLNLDLLLRLLLLLFLILLLVCAS